MFGGTIEDNFSVQQSVMASRVSISGLRPCLRFGCYVCALVLGFALLTSSDSVAQTKKKKKAPQKSEPSLTQKLKKSKADVVSAANDYKASLERLLVLQENDVKAASDEVEKRKELLAQSIISKRELEESERALSAAQDQVSSTKKQIGESDDLIAEATAEQ